LTCWRKTLKISLISCDLFTKISRIASLDFDIPAKTVAGIYKQRRQVKLFFKWIKQHLRIKSFYGTSVNAVKGHI